MRIVLHILLKDLRRHWREVALFAAVTAGWAWQQAHPDEWPWLDRKAMMPMLFFGSWIFVAIRVMHGEVLVGDREFWMTRPYRWWQLLAAKAIFLVVFLNGPMLAMQIYLLQAAGFAFSPAWILGLLFLQIAFFWVVTLPAAAIAAVTESLAQWVIAVVGLAVLAMMIAWVPWDQLPVTLNGAEKNVETLGYELVGALLLVTIVGQFARRKTRTARVLIGCAGMAVPALIAVSSTGLMRTLSYPMDAQSPIRISIPSEKSNGGREYTINSYGQGNPTISVPIEGAAVAPDAVVVIEGSRLELKGDDGWHWSSEWLSQNVELTAEEKRESLSFNIPAEMAKEIAAKHATASVELAVALFHLGEPTRVETSGARYEIPGVGECGWSGVFLRDLMLRGRYCEVPFRGPDLLMVSMESGENTCSARDRLLVLPAGHHAVSLVWNENAAPADFDPNPIHRLNIPFGQWVPAIPDPHDARNSLAAFLCRGTPMTVRTGALSSRMRLNVDLGALGSEKVLKSDGDVGSILFELPRK